MKISDLEKRLKEIKEHHGDLEIVFADEDLNLFSAKADNFNVQDCLEAEGLLWIKDDYIESCFLPGEEIPELKTKELMVIL